ncbi:DNA cytosine methyltransferase [Planococcus ruber]|uniref:DNA cytosine methyltransferase n=1 Tax=Planococcus ruber TaxID=2027871 RepID=UPI001FF00893|nr:DNA cytosine methyltransferase [Planococcus ruber]MCJ1907737.1 DNA cytosine methyltransferase [Planococcus ruber]
MTKQYKILDLFSGAGGLSSGFEQTGRFSVVGAVEINEAAQKTFIRNHGNNNELVLKSPETNKSDITKIDFKSLNLKSDETVVIGGPPCQGFSNANRQKNYLISGNNQLVKEYARAIRDIKPVAFLMENVKSMNSSVHKFFVTNYVEDNLNDFSSQKHLDEISKTGEVQLYEEDDIELVLSNSAQLKEILREFNEISNVPAPLITDALLITRLRTIEQRMKNLTSVQLKNAKEKMEVKKILLLLSNYSAYRNFDSIIINTVEGLQLLLEEPVSSHLLKEKIQNFIDLNRFLTRCQELKDENIFCGSIELVEGSDFTMRVSVFSYNVVQYLKRLFVSYGYSLDSKVLDASQFGVPQRRHRFMMMGIRKTIHKVELPTTNNGRLFTVKDAIKDLESILPQHEMENYNANIYTTPDISSELLNYYREGMKCNLLYDHINTKSSPLIQERYEHILNSKGKNFHSLPDSMKKTYTDASRTQNTVYLRLNYEEPSPTVINVRKSMWQHPSKARALSIREAARLQSFQDKFAFEGRKDERYQQIGNAVPPIMAKAVADKMLSYLI